MFCLENV